MGEIMGRHALQHAARGRFRVDIIGHRHKLSRWNYGVLGVGSRNHRISNSVALLYSGDALAHRIDDTRSLTAESAGSIHRIKTGAMVNIDKIDAARLDLDARFSRPRFGDGNVFVGQYFRSAVIVNSNGFHDFPRRYLTA